MPWKIRKDLEIPSPFLLTKRGLFLLLFTAEHAEKAEENYP
jgi:hypothetical protein